MTSYFFHSFAQIAALSRDDPEAVREGISLALGANLGAGIFISAAVFPIVVLITPSRYARHRHPMDIEDDRRSNEIQSFDEEDGDESDANAPLLPDGSRRPDPGLWRRFDAWTRRGGVEVERGPFIRDVCFYACAVGGVSLAMTKGSVNRTEVRLF